MQPGLVPSDEELVDLMLCVRKLKSKKSAEGNLLLLKILEIELRRDIAQQSCIDIRAALVSRRRVQNADKLEADLVKFEKEDRRCDLEIRKVGTALKALIERPLFPKGLPIKFRKVRIQTLNGRGRGKIRAIGSLRRHHH